MLLILTFSLEEKRKEVDGLEYREGDRLKKLSARKDE
jgi:hypothetical protein